MSALINKLQCKPTPRIALRQSVVPKAVISSYSITDQSTEVQVRSILCSNLGLDESKVSAMLTLPEVSRTMQAVPKYEAHLKFVIMLLTMQIGVDRSTLAPLVAENPTFILSRAPFLKENLRELRRAIAFHFDIFLKTSADELPETWRAMLRQRPDLLLLDPLRAEATLRWLATLFKAAGLGSTTATSFVKYILTTRPELLNQKVKVLQHDANQVWWLAKGHRLHIDGELPPVKASSNNKRALVGEKARARFILAYIALNSDILKHEELKPLHSLQTEIELVSSVSENKDALPIAKKVTRPSALNNIKVR